MHMCNFRLFALLIRRRFDTFSLTNILPLFALSICRRYKSLFPDSDSVARNTRCLRRYATRCSLASGRESEMRSWLALRRVNSATAWLLLWPFGHCGKCFHVSVSVCCLLDDLRRFLSYQTETEYRVGMFYIYRIILHYC